MTFNMVCIANLPFIFCVISVVSFISSVANMPFILSIIYAECCKCALHSECHLRWLLQMCPSFWVSLMLIVANVPFILSVMLIAANVPFILSVTNADCHKYALHSECHAGYHKYTLLSECQLGWLSQKCPSFWVSITLIVTNMAFAEGHLCWLHLISSFWVSRRLYEDSPMRS